MACPSWVMGHHPVSWGTVWWGTLRHRRAMGSRAGASAGRLVGRAGGCFAGRGRICYREAADPGRYRGLAYVRVAE